MVFHFWNVTIPYMYMYQFHKHSISIPYLFCMSSPVPLSDLYFDSCFKRWKQRLLNSFIYCLLMQSQTLFGKLPIFLFAGSWATFLSDQRLQTRHIP